MIRALSKLFLFINLITGDKFCALEALLSNDSKTLLNSCYKIVGKGSFFNRHSCAAGKERSSKTL